MVISDSGENVSVVGLRLEAGADPEKDQKEVQNLLANVQLPVNAGRPAVMTQGLSADAFYYFSVYTENEEGAAELEQAKDYLVQELNSIKGVDQVLAFGEREALISIELNSRKLNQYGISPAVIADQVNATLSQAPIGEATLDGSAQMIRVVGSINSLEHLKKLELSTLSGKTISLDQLAKIETSYNANYISRFNGYEAILFQIYQAEDGNMVNIYCEL